MGGADVARASFGRGPDRHGPFPAGNLADPDGRRRFPDGDLTDPDGRISPPPLLPLALSRPGGYLLVALGEQAFRCFRTTPKRSFS